MTAGHSAHADPRASGKAMHDTIAHAIGRSTRLAAPNSTAAKKSIGAMVHRTGLSIGGPNATGLLRFAGGYLQGVDDAFRLADVP